MTVRNLYIARLFFNKGLPQFHDSLFRMSRALDASGLVETFKAGDTAGMAVDMARNMHILNAIHHNADAIAWLDTDMIFPDDTLIRFVQILNAGFPIAAGLYRCGRAPYNLLCEIEWNKSATLEELEAISHGGLADVAMAAGGFSMVDIRVYLAIAKMLKVPAYCNYDFVSGQGIIGEDRFFVLRAKEVNALPVVDVSMHAIHWPSHGGPVPVTPTDPLMKWCV